jgi:hypothetical protein
MGCMKTEKTNTKILERQHKESLEQRQYLSDCLTLKVTEMFNHTLTLPLD